MQIEITKVEARIAELEQYALKTEAELYAIKAVIGELKSLLGVIPDGRGIETSEADRGQGQVDEV